MRRRDAIPLLAAAPMPVALGRGELDGVLDPRRGAAALVSVEGSRLMACTSGAGERTAPPGSLLKPVLLAALVRSGRLRSGEEMLCSGGAQYGARDFHCVHPRVSSPFNMSSAIAYSCNSYFGRAASRFGPGEVALELNRAGLGTAPGIQDPVRQMWQAFGVESVQADAVTIARLYAGGARQWVARAGLIEGLEAAVRFGTAQKAAAAGMPVAGKTGSVVTRGEPLAWFAGFCPAREPKVAVAVLVAGKSGGADAAPVAASVLEWWRAKAR